MPLLQYLAGQQPRCAQQLRAATLRRPRDVAPAIAERLEARARALDLLVEVVRALPEDDERLLMLGTLVVRSGQFAPGAGTDHALNQFVGGSRVRDVLVETGRHRAGRRDCAAGGHLSPWRPR
jgi:hypothetical protein